MWWEARRNTEWVATPSAEHMKRVLCISYKASLWGGGKYMSKCMGQVGHSLVLASRQVKDVLWGNTKYRRIGATSTYSSNHQIVLQL
jgi:hypothetical protein